jgi:drug/metabolite transporter (DMT)-like permease
VAALLLAPGAALDPPEAMPSAAALAALAVLALVCTAAGLVVYGVLVAEAGAGRALVITYVNPVVAVALGMVFLGERRGPGTLVGLGLILAGSRLATASTSEAQAPGVINAAGVGSPANWSGIGGRAATFDAISRRPKTR